MTKKDFNSDLEFLQKYIDPVVLADADSAAMIIVAPRWQGRVMTSTAKGREGYSFGWINYDHIASGEYLAHMNPYGGENRLWLGPEGGQFSIYFPEDAPMEFDYWQVPDLLDTVSFPVLEKTQKMIRFQKDAKLKNYSGTVFDLKLERIIQLLDKTQVANILGVEFDPAVDLVAYETRNRLSNMGERIWSTESGTLSLWLLDMLKPSDSCTIIIPLQASQDPAAGINDSYFGAISPGRLRIKKNHLLMKADGKQRGKIGIAPQRAQSIAGSYDANNNILNLVRFNLREGKQDFVNSLWEIQEEPFRGDVINAYNDGPLEDGSQMGPFYELETSSPAAFLEPGESLEHIHMVFHFQGAEDDLDGLCQSIFGISLKEINTE